MGRGCGDGSIRGANVLRGLALVLLSLCGASAAWAQSPKVAGGVGFGWYGTDWGMTTERLPGPVIGLGVEWGRGSLLLETDLQYIQKRSRYTSRSWDFTLNELSLPVLLKARLGPGPRAYLVGGGEIALILSQRTADTHGGAMSDVPTATFDYGLIVGAGIEIGVGRAAIEIEGRYHLGLANTTAFGSDSGYDFKTRVLAVLGGVRF